MITIGGIVRVSKKSRSKSAGRFVEIVGLRTNLVGGIKEVKVRIIPKAGKTETQFAYVSPKFLESTEFTGYVAPVVEEVESHDGYVCESNDIHGVVAQDVETTDTSHIGVDFKFPVGSPVFFETEIPFEVMMPNFLRKGAIEKHEIKSMCGWVSDQWVEKGIKLYNVVFLGTFKVLPERCIKNICSRPAFA